MKKNFLTVLKIFVLIALMTLIPGVSIHAAAPGQYKIDMQYDSAKAAIPAQLKAGGRMQRSVIAVAEFADLRPVDDQKAIGWVKELDGSKVGVFPKTVAPTRAVADGIRDYLKKAGYQVADKIVAWDLKEGSLPAGSGKVIIGGSIDELDITCWTGVFSNDYKINMKFSLVVADAARGKILYKGNVSASASRTDTSFSEGQLGHEASVALADAIGRLFEGKTVAEKLKEAIIPSSR
ncbi:MAG: hypothetical protein K4571_04405 [Deltaproteobacteria bacterium]